MLDFIKLVGLGLFTLLPVANPLTSVTLLLALTGNYTEEERNRQVNRATFYVLGIILVCFYAGNAIMDGFGISIPGLRIAGGLIVAYIGFGMLFPAPNQTEAAVQKDMAPEEETIHLETPHGVVRPPPRDISFVPLALPGTAGPGTIALIISTASTMYNEKGLAIMDHVAVATVAVLLTLIFWVCMRSAERVNKFLGPAGIDAISRVMGFLLICMGVQFCINGVFELMGRVVPS